VPLPARSRYVGSVDMLPLLTDPVALIPGKPVLRMAYEVPKK
jgi:hypothetical protein